MAHWTIEAPTSLDFDDVTGLRVRLIAGSVAVLASDEKPALDVSNVSGDPLQVTYENGMLTIAHENLTWEGLLKWLRPQRHSATVTVTVPRSCATQLGVVSANAVMCGISTRASGDVRSEFTELRRSSAPASHSVSGSLGAGSGHVSVTTMSGRVMLLRRAGRRTEPQGAHTGGEQPDNEKEMEGESS